MKGHRMLLILVSLALPMGLLFAQTPVLLDQFTNVGRIDFAADGGQETIFLERTTGNLATGVIVNRDSVHAYVSTDGGVTWVKSTFINASAEQVRNFSVSGDADNPIFSFSKRGSTPSAAPWARHLANIALDDFGWGGGVFSSAPIATAGTEADVLDAYYPKMKVSPFDANLRGLFAHHGSSQSGGEYQQFFYSTDGGQTWSDRVKVVSSAIDDTSEGFYVEDLTSNAADFQYGPDGTVLVAGTARIDRANFDQERLFYATSDDSGKTWSDVSLLTVAANLEIDWSKVDRGYEAFIDGGNNFHIFALGMDTATGVFDAYDFKLVGTTWTGQKIASPNFADINSLVAIESSNGDDGPLNIPTLHTFGTILYSFIDVADTTGGVNDYRMYTITSDDNGDTWSERIELISDTDYNAEEFTGVARNADDNLHIIYNKVTTPDTNVIKSLYYLQVPITDIVSVNDDGSRIVADAFSLQQNYPNPFNPSTRIRFELGRKSQVSLIVYNILGERIATLIENKVLPQGESEVVWDAADFASGMYFYQLKTDDGFSFTRKMVLLK